VVTNPLDNTPPPGKSGFGLATPEGIPEASPSVEPFEPAERVGPNRSVPGLTPSTAPPRSIGPIPDSDRPISAAAAAAGVAVLITAGLSVARRD
jgi:hypothetical protein